MSSEIPLWSRKPTWYPLSVIAKQIKDEVDNVLEVAVSQNIPLDTLEDEVRIHRDNMPALVKALGEGVKRGAYDFSKSSFQYNTQPWAQTLKAIYEEEIAWPACMSPQQGELLRALVRNQNPKVCLEIGCYIGASTMWICSALEECGEDGILHSVDFYGDKMPFKGLRYQFMPDALSYIRGRLEEASLSHRNKQHPGHSHNVGIQYDKRIGEPLDFLFIDGDHTIEGCMKDFWLYERHLKPGGYLVLHDIYPDVCGWEGPAHLIEKYLLPQPNKYRCVDIHTAPANYGMAIIKKLS